MHIRKTALNNSVQVVDIKPQSGKNMTNTKDYVKSEIRNRKNETRNIKWQLNTKVQFKRDVDDGAQEKIDSHFRSKTYVALVQEEDEHEINEAFLKMNQTMEDFIHKGSSWFVKSVVLMEICTVPYAPISG